MGMEPLWASEVEPFAIRVTTKRFPRMKHLGDISRIDGAAVPPVDIITFGSPCTDMSVAGKRAGLDGDQSVLFYQAIRIIKEMRCATDGQYPRYIVWENVPGAFSSNRGADFKAVLDAVVGIAEPGAEVPAPDEGRWPYADVLMGDGWSVAYRTLDAQYFGVAQRRKRIYLVADFGSERAGEILFEREGVCRNFEPRFPQGQGTAGGAAVGAGSAGCRIRTVAFEPGAASRKGGHCWAELAGTLRADAGDNQAAVVYDARGNGDGEIAGTLTGDHQDRVTDYTALVAEPRTDARVLCAAFMGGQGADAGSIAYSEVVAPTLRGKAGGNSVPMAMTAYGICSNASKAMLSSNPHSGFYKADTARTLDQSGGNPCCNQGGIAVCVQGSMIGRAEQNGPQGSGVNAETAFTLNTADRHAVAYAMTMGGFAEVREEQASTLMARDYKDPQAVSVQPHYIVRRLTPRECALLQGFPPDWCAGLETPAPTDEDIAFWSEVWETHRKIMGTSSKPKSRNQIIKWLRNPHSDSAEYKLWGNGVALPCVCFVMAGIVELAEDTAVKTRPAISSDARA
jgi:DNA (cytosine-5)-methyltransferase 1